jgi:hypothetical protein
MDHLPFTCEQLIDVLDEMYPDRCPHLDMTPEQIWHASGQRSVVNFLIELRRRTQEDSNILRNV